MQTVIITSDNAYLLEVGETYEVLSLNPEDGFCDDFQLGRFKGGIEYTGFDRDCMPLFGEVGFLPGYVLRKIAVPAAFTEVPNPHGDDNYAIPPACHNLYI